ncbi:hypothetical protein SERLA73DRAFT_76068 [Serpula lacrymans var. lacrymans S7.3]|uniref:Uncharacterized protein n=2 Tax=Serpula lacrymans var. lacrymans TaxID=341189 RepID=F8Q627_SERL3|nr:uncharacterized protein SERLADRAFT_440842 [Serpula lacrymans var. lacrymans S7.9]EGN96065.1 hypothetical protein SERLA73DRAFT_76068 [Serpula lacrymans var. lacrymans S7.3]EGO21588.1 hypothetical protein SERLADRAFT_440842 [Serpula lacrymans var. lacrymans S7.9]
MHSYPPYPYPHLPSSSRIIRPLPLADFPRYQPTPDLDFPPSPSDTCSSLSTDTSPSPSPHTVRIVCDIPLVAPRPLPYHSPTFLHFDLPDPDEDLSHPPYTQRPSKRKRTTDDHPPPAKRHAAKPPSHPQLHPLISHTSAARRSAIHPHHRIRRR